LEYISTDGVNGKVVKFAPISVVAAVFYGWEGVGEGIYGRAKGWSYQRVINVVLYVENLLRPCLW
jgi:hypothetical protein